MSELQTQTLPTSIESEMRTSFIDYAMSVIIARALPNVRDGLKPVHRRILYAMHELKNFHNQPYKKSARIVGDVIGRYHPHGDQAVYDALVRMAQEFSLRYPLADGQGNFGSIDGDPAAAMRYTEVRMAKIGGEMLADIEKETCDFVPNYDDKEQEPEILPTRIPNLLVNGAQGIAVGMATNIPPHNLTEVLNAAIALAKNPQTTLGDIMKLMPGPDFPTAGFIYGREGIVQAYQTGKGSIIMRARTSIEEHPKSKKQAIIVTELPYMVNKARLIEKIAELVKDKRIEGISDIRDESDRDGIRMVIELKRDAVGEVLLNQLYKLTPLQETFGINMLAIVDGRPAVLPLIDMIHQFIEHRRDVVTRRTAFDLHEAEKRAHILEGLKIALDNLDAVIETIRRSPTPAEAKVGLIQKFSLSEVQAQAILEMRLQRLTGLEREKILAELAELLKLIDYYKSLLADRVKLLSVVVTEMEEMRDKFGDERRTEILDAKGEIQVEDLIAEEAMVVTVTHTGYLKRNPISAYRAQKRGGRGVTGISTHDEDFVRQIFIANTHDYILMFTNTGRVFCKRVYEIPQASRASKGKAIVNLLELRPDETVHEMLALKEFSEGKFVMMATRHGVVKKTNLMEFANIRSTGIIAIEIDDGDSLVDVQLTDGQMHVLMTTRHGMAVRFAEDKIRPMGRTARGVRGIKLREGDKLVAMAVLEPQSESAILTVCERGYGKRTSAKDFSEQNRGGIGVRAIKTTERNGLVVCSLVVNDEEEVMIITGGGKIIRMAIKGIPRIGRNTAGVRLIRLDEAEKVMSVEPLAEKDEEGEAAPLDPSVAIDAEAMAAEAAAEEAQAAAEVEETPGEDESGDEEPK